MASGLMFNDFDLDVKCQVKRQYAVRLTVVLPTIDVYNLYMILYFLQFWRKLMFSDFDLDFKGHSQILIYYQTCVGVTYNPCLPFVYYNFLWFLRPFIFCNFDFDQTVKVKSQYARRCVVLLLLIHAILYSYLWFLRNLVFL